MSGECGIFVGLHSSCDVAKSCIHGDEIYGTTDDNTNSGECYTNNVSGGFGCGVFVKGDGCQLKGTVMQAAYDHLMDYGCKICGQAGFSNGCHMRVDYVSGCKTQNDGPAHFVSFEEDSSATSRNSGSSPVTLASSSLTSSWTTTTTSGYVESSPGLLLR
ncbi:hypothetical protein BDW69DRAFT_179991 [Aspergillus filifer]